MKKRKDEALKGTVCPKDVVRPKDTIHPKDSKHPKQKNEKKENTKGKEGLERKSTCDVIVILVCKTDESWRMFIDYCPINVITIRYMHPIPRLDDLLDELYGAYIFSKMDMHSSYHQVHM
ncbi:hypothetical protein CR513_09428, partial [Mucuna pruriens]